MRNDLRSLGSLIRRGLKNFLSDKMAVFLSLLAPIIILFLYLMFLSDVQMDSVAGILDEMGLTVADKPLGAYIDGWMLAGVLATSCITVSFCAQTVMIGDRERGVIADMLTSPVSRNVLSLSYFVVNWIITSVLIAILMVIALVYMAIVGFYMSAADVGKLIGVLLLSVTSASLFSTLICMFIRTQSAHGGASGILSAAIGFFIGAYMPISFFPKFIQGFVLFVPGTYSASILRNVFMRGALQAMCDGLPTAAISPLKDSLADAYSMSLNGFGGATINEGAMWLILAGTALLFALLYAVIQFVRAKTGTLFADAGLRRIKKHTKHAR